VKTKNRTIFIQIKKDEAKKWFLMKIRVSISNFQVFQVFPGRKVKIDTEDET
jgi:hypothetical protein